MPEFDGPWNKPTPPAAGPPTAPNRRIPLGLAIWAGILATAIAAVAFLTWKYPTAVPKAESPDVWYLFGLLALVTSGLVGLRRVNSSAGTLGSSVPAAAHLLSAHARMWRDRARRMTG